MTVTIQPPTLENDVLQQTAENYINAADGSDFYWLYRSDAEGLKTYKANGDTIPPLNPDHPAWNEIQNDSYFDGLYDLGPSTVAEKAYLTDARASAYGQSFEQNYNYFGWSESLVTIQAESVLFPV